MRSNWRRSVAGSQVGPRHARRSLRRHPPISDADLEFLAPDHSGDYATELAAIGFSGRLAAVTLGADGTWYKAGARTGQVPSPHVVVVETTGSGDAFTACLLDSLIPRRFDLDSISDDELRGILRRACAAGALTATGYGRSRRCRMPKRSTRCCA